MGMVIEVPFVRKGGFVASSASGLRIARSRETQVFWYVPPVVTLIATDARTYYYPGGTRVA
jgi:hypothetical protein